MQAYKTLYVRPIVELGVTVVIPFKKRDIYLLESVRNNNPRELMMRWLPVDYSSDYSSQIPNGRQGPVLLMYKMTPSELFINLTDYFFGKRCRQL